jgi:regulator of sigma E protease
VIRTIDGEPINDFEKLKRKGLLGSEMVVLRDGKEITLHFPPDMIGQLVENKARNKESGFIEPRRPAIAYYVPDTSKIFQAGLRQDDQIIAVDTSHLQFIDELQNELKANKNKTVSLTVLRSGHEVSFPVQVTSEGKLGFVPYGIDYQQMDSLHWLTLEVKKYPFFAAFPAGVRRAGTELGYYIDQFKKILNPRTGAAKGLGGFKAIASIFPKYGWDWEAFWTITAFLSIVLAFMNLLPIPALDGGHVMFTLYEMITQRKPSDKFLEYAQMVGMVLLLALMIYANGNDWFGWGK